MYEDAIHKYFEFTGVDLDFLTTGDIVSYLSDMGLRDNPRAMSMAVGAALRRLGTQARAEDA